MSTFLSVSFGSQLLNFLQRCLRNRRFFHDLHAKGDGLTHADIDIGPGCVIVLCTAGSGEIHFARFTLFSVAHQLIG